MNQEKVQYTIKVISGAFIDLEEAKQNHKALVDSALDEIKESEDLTADECKSVKKVAQELSKNKLDRLEEFTNHLLTIIGAARS